MSEQTQAASSPAEVDVFQGQEPTFAEYSQYRLKGEIPERFKPAETAESAPADAPEETAESEGEEPESASESESEPETQEPPQKVSPAQKRILQLLAENKELKRKAEAAAKQGVPPDSPPAQPSQQPAQPQYTRPEPTPDDKSQDGTLLYDTYEKYVKALARWEVEQELVQRERAAAAKAQAAQFEAKVSEARSRYADFEDVIVPAVSAVVNDQAISPVVKAMLEESDLLPDLAYTIGSKPEELANFVKMARTSPGKALRYIALTENLIREELSKGKPEETESQKAPETKKTQAPKPPSPVSGGSSRAFDVNDESLSTEEWARKRNAQLRRQGKA